MALIKCPECGNNVSDQAQVCPKCGFPNKQIHNGAQETTTTFIGAINLKDKTKKNIIIVFLILFLATISILFYNMSCDKYRMSNEIIGIEISEKDMQSLSKYEILRYSIKLKKSKKIYGENFIKDIFFEEETDKLPAKIIGVSERCTFTYGTKIPPGDSTICKSAEECQLRGEKVLDKLLTKAIKQYGESYREEESELLGGTILKYTWDIGDKNVYVVARTRIDKYYPEYNSFMVMHSFSVADN